MGRHSSGERRGRLDEPDAVSRDGARSDLRVLLHSRKLLLASAVVVVVVCGAYFGVLAALGRLHDWLIVLVIPAGIAGVCVGALLDRAQRAPGPSSEADTDAGDPAERAEADASVEKAGSPVEEAPPTEEDAG
jgi:hypothetical protein